jgi:hypothetical protein
MIHYKPFEFTVGEHADSENSDSSGSDSDSSSSSSSSSDNSDSPKERRNSRIHKSLIPAPPSPRTKAITARSNVQDLKNEQQDHKVKPQSNLRQFIPKAPSGAPGRVSSRAAAIARKKIPVRKKIIVKDTSEFDAAREAERAALERKHRIHANFKSKGAVYIQDTLQSVLEAMAHVGRSRAFVVSDTGDILGVITLKDIAKYLIQKEEEEKLVLRREVEIEGGEFVINGDTLGADKGLLLASGAF